MKLLEAGVRVYFASGSPIQEEYSAIGKDVRNARGSRVDPRPELEF